MLTFPPTRRDVQVPAPSNPFTRPHTPPCAAWLPPYQASVMRRSLLVRLQLLASYLPPPQSLTQHFQKVHRGKLHCEPSVAGQFAQLHSTQETRAGCCRQRQQQPKPG